MNGSGVEQQVIRPLVLASQHFIGSVRPELKKELHFITGPSQSKRRHFPWRNYVLASEGLSGAGATRSNLKKEITVVLRGADRGRGVVKCIQSDEGTLGEFAIEA